MLQVSVIIRCTHAHTHAHAHVHKHTQQHTHTYLKRSPLVVAAQTATGHLFLSQQTQHICGGPVCSVAPIQVDH